MSAPTSTRTFLGLIRECGRIEIPRIQRDYVQGRSSAKSVRDAFLVALHEAVSLPADDSRLPMNLDFIYGSRVSVDGLATFQPLDGQQRLTTLCLMHWYAAWTDGEGPAFREEMLDGHRSRFTYSVRPSSQEFFDELMAHEPTVKVESLDSVRTYIEDQHWFFLYWRLDPTINAALGMLDAIHERFRETADLYSRLTDAQHPAITFELLLLEHFGLADDLYIKMNARGRPLTSFEVFKARTEEHLRENHSDRQHTLNGEQVPLATYFANRADNQWTHFFWAHVAKNTRTAVFDREALNLLWALARACVNTTRTDFTAICKILAAKDCAMSFDLLRTHQLLKIEFLQRSICLLDMWSREHGELAPAAKDSRFEELAFFTRAVKNPAGLNYSDLAMFGAFVRYLSKHEGEVHEHEMRDWMRVVFNLVNNSDCGDADEFLVCSRAIVMLLRPGGREVLKVLASPEPTTVRGFQRQLPEELLKAKLILSHEGWRARIEEAEGHTYFRGQIEFLLEFSDAKRFAKEQAPAEWSADRHQQVQARFDDCLAKADLMFGDKGLRATPNHGWQRALLACGDYLIERGQNWSFCKDTRDHADSWQAFLRSPNREHLRALWDRLDATKPIDPQLLDIISNGPDIDDWRSVIVKHPQVISYCVQGEVRFDESEIYLLKSRQMNGFHAELYSYALNLELLAAPRRYGQLRLSDYISVKGGEYQPCVCIKFDAEGSEATLKVFSWRGAFSIEISSVPHETEVCQKLCTLGFQPDNDQLKIQCKREGIHDLLACVAGCV
jgi:hypothetical protein